MTDGGSGAGAPPDGADARPDGAGAPPDGAGAPPDGAGAPRSTAERVADVRRLLETARRVYEGRAALTADLCGATGLSVEGVELGFASLERQADDAALASLVRAAGDARHVHVVLSSNVFVAPLRALCLARAAAPRVTVRASPRDPVLARALVETLADPAVTLTTERDVAALEADALHVYGRGATLAAVRARARPATRVTGHGPGLGIALVTPAVDVDVAAGQLVLDVVAFDQRGCLSPRLVLVVGDASRARAFAEALHIVLQAQARLVPRGRLDPEEVALAARWRDAVAFAGDLWTGPAHAVGVVPGPGLLLPPPGRHVQVVAIDSVAQARREGRLAPLARAIVAVGSDDDSAAAQLDLPHARRSALGRMQRPPLDGPVDRRTVDAVT